jgi:hypothetical protein
MFLTLVFLPPICVEFGFESVHQAQQCGSPNEAPPLEEAEPQQGHFTNKSPSPNSKRPSTCLAETGQMAASRTYHQGDNATVSGSSVETDCGRDTSSSALIGSGPDQEVVQDEATIPSGWTCVKLEPDCYYLLHIIKI